MFVRDIIYAVSVNALLTESEEHDDYSSANGTSVVKVKLQSGVLSFPIKGDQTFAQLPCLGVDQYCYVILITKQGCLISELNHCCSQALYIGNLLTLMLAM